MNITSIQSYNANNPKKNPNFGMFLGEVTGEASGLSRQAMHNILFEAEPAAFVKVHNTGTGFRLTMPGFMTEKPIVHEGEGQTEEAFKTTVQDLAAKYQEDVKRVMGLIFPKKLNNLNPEIIIKDFKPKNKFELTGLKSTTQILMEEDLRDVSDRIGALLKTVSFEPKLTHRDETRVFAEDLQTQITEFAQKQGITLERKKDSFLTRALFERSKIIENVFNGDLKVNTGICALDSTLGRIIETLQLRTSKSLEPMTEQQKAALEMAQGLRAKVEQFAQEHGIRLTPLHLDTKIREIQSPFSPKDIKYIPKPSDKPDKFDGRY